jgi:hypothetical protein
MHDTQQGVSACVPPRIVPLLRCCCCFLCHQCHCVITHTLAGAAQLHTLHCCWHPLATQLAACIVSTVQHLGWGDQNCHLMQACFVQQQQCCSTACCMHHKKNCKQLQTKQAADMPHVLTMLYLTVLVLCTTEQQRAHVAPSWPICFVRCPHTDLYQHNYNNRTFNICSQPTASSAASLLQLPSLP